MAKLHLPHAIVVRLHVRKINFVILTPETMGIVGVLSSSSSLPVGFSIQEETMDVVRGVTAKHSSRILLGY